jgi:hypothetical protein
LWSDNSKFRTSVMWFYIIKFSAEISFRLKRPRFQPVGRTRTWNHKLHFYLCNSISSLASRYGVWYEEILFDSYVKPHWPLFTRFFPDLLIELKIAALEMSNNIVYGTFSFAKVDLFFSAFLFLKFLVQQKQTCCMENSAALATYNAFMFAIVIKNFIVLLNSANDDEKSLNRFDPRQIMDSLMKCFQFTNGPSKSSLESGLKTTRRKERDILTSFLNAKIHPKSFYFISCTNLTVNLISSFQLLKILLDFVSVTVINFQLERC